MDTVEIKDYLKTKWADVDAYIFMAKVKDILPIYYVAVRGRDSVEGAVQRVLNKRRIENIKDFILDGNMFFNTFILNWTNTECPVTVKNGKIVMPIISSAAQVIDGQHRLAGLSAAIEKNDRIGDESILIVLTQNMTTKDAAKIFLNINTEQKPVPQSLVYDLFGEVKGKDSNIVRAKDLADKLNDDKDSPYYQCVKRPGAAQGVGKIDLATIVNSVKGYTTEDGIFSQYNIDDFELQYTIITNFFWCLKQVYQKEGNWLKSSNPFMCNAGFFPATKFLCEDLFLKCIEKKSFEKSTMQSILKLEDSDLIVREDIKNMQGKEQRNEIYKFLKKSMLREMPRQDEYRF